MGTGEVHAFGDWPNLGVPNVAAGAYTVWRGDELIYAGMAGRSLTPEIIEQHLDDPTKVTGLRSRLNSHASGRRSGDQFCVYACDRLVLGDLAPGQIAAISTGETKLDDLVKHYIRTNLTYRYIATTDGTQARRVEGAIRSGALQIGKPLLNPA